MNRRANFPTIVACLLASALPCPAASARDLRTADCRCKGHPELVGPCFLVHGRLFIANGTPGVRIWWVGTKRILGVVSSEDEIMPEHLAQYLSRETRIYGDFIVCPFTKRKSGAMQPVCIESASNLIVERLGQPGEPPMVFRLPKTP